MTAAMATAARHAFARRACSGGGSRGARTPIGGDGGRVRVRSRSVMQPYTDAVGSMVRSIRRFLPAVPLNEEWISMPGH